MEGATRLDKLLELLDNGTTMVTRKAAAEQIGEIQKLHPFDLQQLLLKVHRLLQSTKWDTRVAAGHAVAAICAQVPLWAPEQRAKEEADDDGGLVTATGDLRFASFDIERVLRHGTVLLASGGAEFDDIDDDLSPAEKLERQRQALEKRMGISVQLAGLDDLISDEDLVNGPSAADKARRERIQTEEERRQSAQIAEELGKRGQMSARERNQAKRMAKINAKNKQRDMIRSSASALAESMVAASSQKATKVVATEQHKSDKVVMESVVDTDAAGGLGNDRYWPFEIVCSMLCSELFDAQWEVRHGAAIALREILKVHASGAGRSALDDPQQQDKANAEWLEDCCVRLVCVFALDRFCDFVGDQAVAPVRETAAQALGALVKHMPPNLAMTSVQALLALLAKGSWDVRLGVLLGIKYCMAVRADIADQLLRASFSALLQGLQDVDDDVRAVASDTLLPVAAQVALLGPDAMAQLLAVLWNALTDLDDLTASTSSVMKLLAGLYAQPASVPAMALLASQHPDLGPIPLVTLIPRLFPFFRHTIPSVRLSTLETVQKLIRTAEQGRDHWLGPLLPYLLFFVFQNFALEEHDHIAEKTLEIWQDFLAVASREQLTNAVSSHLAAWFTVLNTPDVLPVDPAKLQAHLQRSHAGLQKRSRDEFEEGNNSLADGAAKRGKVTVGPVSIPDCKVTATASCPSRCSMRALGCQALGLLANCMTEAGATAMVHQILIGLSSSLGSSRMVACMCIEEWQAAQESSQQPGIPLPQEVKDHCMSLVTAKQSAFEELSTPMEHVVQAYAVLVRNMRLLGATEEFITDTSQLTIDVAVAVAKVSFNAFMASKGKDQAEKVQNQLQLQRATLLNRVTTLEQQHHTIENRSQASAACAVIALGDLPKTLSAVIRPLMNAIKAESDEGTQQRSASALARLVQLLRGKAKPRDLVLRNLCKFAAVGGKTSATEAERLQHRGAVAALQSIAQRFGASLVDALPALWGAVTQPIVGFDPSKAQELLDAAESFKALVPALDHQLRDKVFELFASFVRLVTSDLPAVRGAVAKCVAVLCKSFTLHGLQATIEHMLPLMGAADDVNSRAGAAETLHMVISTLELDIIPYLVLLVGPLLARMSDQDETVRRLVTSSFASLVRLMPLEAGVADPVGMPAALIEEKKEKRRFLEQLLDGSKLDRFELSVPLKAELRSYQQDGLNWLGFLHRYNLHGILCDDMGLGKTLQTLCVVISDNNARKEAFERTGSADCRPLPSLVLCPPTVVGHWYHEVGKFFPGYCKPLQYSGVPAERAMLRKKIPYHDLIVMSYEVLRNDIQALGDITWNYAVLDEGHIIRNNKTKLTQAVKQVRANHRLILSGTPIQNNVLELWSLFDFLMPGFLGSESQFNSMFSKPILAGKDPKSSQADQEAGARALEALHRQVLPFLLRRVKEDVLHDLPPKIIQDRYCELSELQARLYESFGQSSAKKVLSQELEDPDSEMDVEQEGKKQKKKGAVHTFQALQYLRKLCNHPLLVLDKSHPNYDEVMRTEKDLHSLTHSPKLMALQQLLQECGVGLPPGDKGAAELGSVGQHRVLIFAQLTSMLDIIEKDLFKRHMPSLSFLRLDGKVPHNKRHDLVMKFNADPTIDVLLLTTHVGGLGLNLTGADTVIFVEHDWNPMRDLQAMDRAHRLGQTKVVNVYRLITRGTLEEKIMGLQKFKIHIANSIVNKDNSSISTMDTNQLLDLFNYSDAPSGKAGKNEASVDEFGNVVSKKKATSGLKAVMEDLEELWDESQYEEEYNLSGFLASL